MPVMQFDFLCSYDPERKTFGDKNTGGKACPKEIKGKPNQILTESLSLKFNVN